MEPAGGLCRPSSLLFLFGLFGIEKGLSGRTEQVPLRPIRRATASRVRVERAPLASASASAHSFAASVRRRWVLSPARSVSIHVRNRGQPRISALVGDLQRPLARGRRLPLGRQQTRLGVGQPGDDRLHRARPARGRPGSSRSEARAAACPRYPRPAGPISGRPGGRVLAARA